MNELSVADAQGKSLTLRAIYEYFDDCYLAKKYMYRDLYGLEHDHNIKLPAQSAVKKDITVHVLEPIPTVKKERSQKKRFASGGETPSNSTAKRRRCGNCGGFSHNTRTCPNHETSALEE
ncbi:unnamed protein product [Phytophthora fragariaefolia]|uniref:Unnamed protein product n=1 Tax=Phytophthora fragariaefolia TaxID=1490495 RepID=A0A9W7CZ82_9STRA|nr:unnamed protein product [Phytophthora fragariaefolia]